MPETKLFTIRPMVLFTLLISLPVLVNGQIVDELLGQRRTKVQALLKPFRILDYKKEREVHNIESGIHQTVLFENDTCKRFYWAVTPNGIDRFKSLLLEAGYSKTDVGFSKDSLNLTSRELNSGKATLFIASISEELKGKRDVSGQIIEKKKTVVRSANVDQSYVPLMQQQIAEEEKKDTVPKPRKDPKIHWVGTRSGNTSVLGWEQ